jgi:hypothetical protein
LISFLLGAFISYSFAAIHGSDNMRLSEEIADSRLVEISNSVAAKIPTEVLTSELGFSVENLQSKKSFCSYESFATLPSIATCTGVLIAPDKILTTFHCLRTEDECAKSSWTFSYRVGNLSHNSARLNPAETYRCARIVASNTHLLNFKDYTIIQLDRSVLDRKPVTYRKDGKVSSKDTLAIIGHPYGLPSITAINGHVLENDKPHVFSTDLDAFAGNSGSPVINTRTYEIEGIFIRGGVDTDLDWNSEPLCKVWKRCENADKCETEDVTRITSVPLDQILGLNNSDKKAPSSQP